MEGWIRVSGRERGAEKKCQNRESIGFYKIRSGVKVFVSLATKGVHAGGLWAEIHLAAFYFISF